MAKRKTTHSAEQRDIVKICAFWGMSIAALLYLFSGIINFLIKILKELSVQTANMLGTVQSVFSFVANIALVVAIALPAYRYVAGKNKNWKIFYWIMLVIFALGIVFGMLGGIL